MLIAKLKWRKNKNNWLTGIDSYPRDGVVYHVWKAYRGQPVYNDFYFLCMVRIDRIDRFVDGPSGTYMKSLAAAKSAANAHFKKLKESIEVATKSA